MKFKGNFINGTFILPRKNVRSLISQDPGDLDHPVGEFTFSASAAEEAVKVANAAFPKWSSLNPKQRCQYLTQFQEALKKRARELGILISQEMGKPLKESLMEVDRMIVRIDISRSREIHLLESEQHLLRKGLVGHLKYRPRGVLAVLSPFNLPAYLASYQVFTALLWGNTVVLKPSELTPFVGQFLAGLWREARLPRGVFNLVQGGRDVGQKLVTHPALAGVFFTGSWQTGSKIQELVKPHPQKICALEMGGKNAALILTN